MSDDYQNYFLHPKIVKAPHKYVRCGLCNKAMFRFKHSRPTAFKVVGEHKECRYCGSSDLREIEIKGKQNE